MDRNTIFRRTAASQDEIKTRQRGIDHNHRFVLIMVDSRSNVAQLEAKSAGRWDTLGLLQDLWDQGLIEPANTAAISVSAGTASAGQSIVPQSAASAQSDIKAELTAAVRAIMGEQGGEKLIAKIQASEISATALADAVDSGCIFIKLTVSESKANTLKERLHGLLADYFDRSAAKGFFNRR